MENDREYWALIAQIIPVLMLALVIEWRVLARRYVSDPSRFRASRSSRVIATFFHMASAVLTLYALLLSLRGARIGTLTYDEATWATVGFFSALLAAFMWPATTLGTALIGDLYVLLYLRSPNSPHNRSLRKLRHLRERSEAFVRTENSKRLSRRIALTAAWIEHERRIRRLPVGAPARLPSPIEKDLEALLAEKKLLDEHRQKMEERLELGVQLTEEFKEKRRLLGDAEYSRIQRLATLVVGP